jgi:hypothetical protein
MDNQATLSLPEPISAYLLADQQTPEAVARCFTAQAVLSDVGRIHTGTKAIKAWKAEAEKKYTYTMTPFAIERAGEFHVVRVHVVGTFAGSPLDMTLRFKLERGLIASMEITV